MNQQTPGLEVPIHRSLIEPILLAGIPRNLAFINWTITAALAFGMRQIWVIAIGLALHSIFSMLTKVDPHFFDNFMRELKSPERLLP